MYSIQTIIWVALLVIIIYLAVRRYNISKNETFEDRDN